ncbi:MAG: hypothetical protein COU46_02355 [Candidatus Niyogibacteria bacterium CG10_big_fil_rev_8_21_14_0_10_42_19]|uniref:PpiC domain-containing protein n=1 Tax=Candidatus Niyogibacteria bacterium CG10_big_fil_rev_8_21_14_0_10_42_19 TaxID=1974725 RepID=A0A2H0THI1_9BACT|nr:MAG: hypothetical protein COU46_02355 [Candidatus Niyogibacteria bacterium CG10_big_fil_rev_8_21_14_0_10_42_19]
MDKKNIFRYYKAMKKKIILGILLLALVFLFIYSKGWYVVAKVDKSYLWASEYYQRVGSLEKLKSVSKNDALAEIITKKNILEGMIENSIINAEFSKKDLSEEHAEKIITDALSNKSSTIAEASQKLYGLKLNDFKKLILLPQAKQDILATDMEKNGINFDKWINERSREVSVKIYFLPWMWENGQLVDKSR